MANSAIFGFMATEFDAFVYASIGEERNGMLLSVLSALVRLDVDPWREAAELAKMPPDAANQRLTSLIESLPDKPSTRPEPRTIATRLMALLPRAARPSVATSTTALHVRAAPKGRDLFIVMAMSLLLLGALFGAQWSPTSPEPTNSGDSGQAATSAADGVKAPSPIYPR